MATTTANASTMPAASESSKGSSTSQVSAFALTPNLAVKDVPESIKFYTEKLGFKLTQTHPCEKDTTPVWASLTFGDNVKIMISSKESMEGEYEEVKTGDGFGKGMTLYLGVNDCEKYCDQLKEKGVKLLKEPSDMFYGMREFAIVDPSGYVWTMGSMMQGFVFKNGTLSKESETKEGDAAKKDSQPNGKQKE